mgnify:CR=1 FL=1
MKNRKYIQTGFIALVLVATLGACSKGVFKKTNTGLQYQVAQKGKGPKPQDGQFMLFDMLYQTEQGKTLFNSADQEIPLALQYYDSVYQKDGGFKEVVSMLQKGDSTIFKLSAKTLLGQGFEHIAKQHALEDSATLLLHMHVKDVMSEENFKEWEEKQFNMMKEQWKEQATKQLKKDLETIDNYLVANKLTAHTTDSGLRYVIDKPGQGDHPKPSNTVKVNYIGKTLEGQVFDTNLVETAKQHGVHNPLRTYEPLQFKIGECQVIAGWEEGIKLLTKGAKARLFIPSTLAYGVQAVGEHIKANENLVFEVELVDISAK